MNLLLSSAGIDSSMTVVRPLLLVAEDNLVMADVLRFNLERAGFDVEVAATGLQAARLLAEREFDVILTDFQMPGINGEGICRLAREDERHRHVPILLISAKSFELDVRRLTEEYALSRVLAKPFSPREVVQTVREALAEAGVIAAHE